jgi:hypothetical protein
VTVELYDDAFAVRRTVVTDGIIDAGFVVVPIFLPIFLDGFETNNTIRWSTTVP